MLLNAVGALLPPGMALIAALASSSPNPVWLKHSTGARGDDASSSRETRQVTAAAKRPQEVRDAPASVTVITADEIRSHGYRTLGEALRWVRGVFVTYDRNHAYVGLRGLQRPGDHNDKVLITIDGHTVNGDPYADAWVGSELGLDMESVERIEIVRGPMSALYGSGAALAVVNVVTRTAIRDPGVRASAGAGRHGERSAYAAIGMAPSGWPKVRVSGSWQDVPGLDLFYPEYDRPPIQSGWAVDADGERAWDMLSSVEWFGMRLAAKFNQRTKRLPTGAFGTTFGDRRTLTVEGRDFIELSGSHSLSPSLALAGRAFWDGARHRGDYVFGPPESTTVHVDRGDGDLLGTEWRGHWSPDALHAATVGIEAQLPRRMTLEDFGLEPPRFLIDPRGRRPSAAAFVEDYRKFRDIAALTTGARIDHVPGFDAVFSPRVDLVVRPDDDTSWKLLAGSAFRAPSPYESALDPASPIRPPLRPERIVTWELAIERSEGPVASTISVYENHARDLIDFAYRGPLGAPVFVNRSRVRGRGVEAEMEASNGGYQTRVSASWQVSRDLDTGAELANSPRWITQTVVTRAVPGSPQSLAVGLRFLSPRLTLAGQRTAAAWVLDGRVGRVLSPALEMAFEWRNLFDTRYGDPVSSAHLQDQIIQDPRSLIVRLNYPARP